MFMVAFALVVVLCINRPFSAGFDCILYSSSLALKLHLCTLIYIEIHTFYFLEKIWKTFVSTLPLTLEAGKRLLFSDVSSDHYACPMQYRKQYITHSRHPLSHEELNLVKQYSLGSPKQFVFGKRSCPTTYTFVHDWPKICTDDTACGSSEVVAAGWKESHTVEHSGCVVKLLLAK